ncbi:aspartyl/asparaginyl beta-hydroxylase domain-containing protein [Sphingomonas piscis]|uniref:Aspartyl/asparaginyl beta-hydroxylase domain-containing protein n=1 Tax=Sphingomonas piscis TaxID=2714943 RepID=A0A6G7YN35_9SPHN|nr:aspartyl/asparaginyl beta-hydroxylase domain-containing protein [Sphingomonas piscis]QIK78151.1 aspartyl/asparaginyl beta-hydroxylase domain-containing protein [Sphingomonas piscis]
MRVAHPLLKLPFKFCAETLAREVAALPKDAWVEHPSKIDGNLAVRLVSPGGAHTDDWVGAMAPTPFLQQTPYIRQIMEALDAPWGRSRLMGLEAGATVPHHVDVHYYWRTHLRIHVPIVTNPGVEFTCDGTTVHMAAGECWLLDSFFPHSVENRGEDLRIHLVLDTVGSSALWDLIDAAATGASQPTLVAPGGAGAKPLLFEQVNAPEVMSPWEIKSHIAYIFDWMDDDPKLTPVQQILDRFVTGWAGVWAVYGTNDSGIVAYLRLIKEVREQLARSGGKELMMRNGWPMLDSLQRYVLGNAVLPAKVQRFVAAARAAQQAATA